MELTLTTTQTQSRLGFSQLTMSQTAKSAVPQSPLPPVDRIELSDEARRPDGREESIRDLRSGGEGQQAPHLPDLLKDILGGMIGAQIDDIQSAPSGESGQTGEFSLDAQRTTLSLEAASASFDGAISTSDGSEVSFSLDIQIAQLSASSTSFSLNRNNDGSSFAFSGSAAELTSTSFSFSLSAEAADGTRVKGRGIGTFSLKDEVRDVRNILRPSIREFFHDAGMPSGTGRVNHLLNAVA